MKFAIGIRPTIDGRRKGIREGLEDQTMKLAQMAADLIQQNVFYADGEKVRVVIADTTIGGCVESAACAEKFQQNNVIATLTVTPCWCYGLETMDLDPLTVKAVWGYNGTERPGAVYLAAVMAAYGQRGFPAFSIYGRDVQDATDDFIPEDVKEKILRFARCSVVVGSIRNKSYLNIGAISMGIGGSNVDALFMQQYLGIRTEWVDMTELLRRIHLGIYDKEQYEKCLAWIKAKCPEGIDVNKTDAIHAEPLTDEEKAKKWDFIAKMTVCTMDLLIGSKKVQELGYIEEGNGHNAIVGGFQGQRNWTDWLPNGDFMEAILNSTFDWNGKRQPIVLATENDTLNGIALLFSSLLTHQAACFCDVRTYWSPEAVERVTGWKPTGHGSLGFLDLRNSGAAALDGSGEAVDAEGNHLMKRWWDVTDGDIEKMLKATDWPMANMDYFRGGGFSSHYLTKYEMPLTIARINLIEGVGPVLQVAEGYSVVLPENVEKTISNRTDPTWPTTFFAPICNGKGAFRDAYTVMANWGANHCAYTYGHIGRDLITLASMLRIPVAMHNVPDESIFRPHSWSAFGTQELEPADFAACQAYGPLYK